MRMADVKKNTPQQQSVLCIVEKASSLRFRCAADNVAEAPALDKDGMVWEGERPVVGGTLEVVVPGDSAFCSRCDKVSSVAIYVELYVVSSKLCLQRYVCTLDIF